MSWGGFGAGLGSLGHRLASNLDLFAQLGRLGDNFCRLGGFLLSLLVPNLDC